MKNLLLVLVAFVGCAASPLVVAAQPIPDGLGALIRQLVVDSLRGGGDRAEAVLVAADSASAALLRLADVATAASPRPPALMCPGSTEADGRPASPPVGYLVHVTLAVGTDTTARQLRVTKSCGFHYWGRVRGYAEGTARELRRQDGRWRVTATLYLWET